MIRLLSFLLLACVHLGLAQQQGLQQIGGVVKDDLSLQLIAGATVQIINDSVKLDTITDQEGNFLFEIPYGRYLLNVSKKGYTTFQTELVVISGKEPTINIVLHTLPYTLDSVSVQATRIQLTNGERQLSMEKSIRIPANFFDPVRMMTSYPGVQTANDQNNGIIIRGNSPNGLLWRLNGLAIVNPNHLANAGVFSDKPAANGGGVNVMSAQVLDNANVFTGTIPANFGNLLSGVVDMTMRSGNTNTHEYTAQASLIGLDVAAEGPLRKNGSASYLVNYRYSTVGLLSQMGLKFGDESIHFHDLSFNLNVPTRNNSTFSVFGFAGDSKNTFEAKDSINRKEDKDWYDIDYEGTSYGVGITYRGSISNKMAMSYGLSYSETKQERTAYFNRKNERVFKEAYFFNQKITSGFIRLEGNVPNGQVSLGVNSSYQSESLFDRDLLTYYIFNPCSNCISTQFSVGNRSEIIIQPYWNWRSYLSTRLITDIGLRFSYFDRVDYFSTEPRTSITYLFSNYSSIEFSYGITSQRQVLPIYVRGENALTPTIMDRFSVGYGSSWGQAWSFRCEVFYQKLRNIPIDLNSPFSAFNFMGESVPNNLVNQGRAKNYGVDVTFEKLFTKNHYFIAGGSIYKSVFTDSSDMERASRFDGTYTFTATYGREWIRSKNDKTLGINTRLVYLGGLREAPVDLVNSRIQYETYYDYSNGFTNKLNDYVRLDFRINWIKNRPKYTRTLAIDIQNLLSIENEAYHYYDFTQDKKIVKKQLGIIPIVIYRIDF